MTAMLARRPMLLFVAPPVTALLVVACLAWSYGQRPADAKEFVFPHLTARYDVQGALSSLAVLLAALFLP